MAVTPYITVEDVAARLGRELDPTTEVPKAEALIQDVSSLVFSFCRRDFAPEVPGDVKAIVAAEVIASMNSNPGISSEDVGDVKVEYRAVPGGLSMSAQRALRKYRPRSYSAVVQSKTWAP